MMRNLKNRNAFQVYNFIIGILGLADKELQMSTAISIVYMPKRMANFGKLRVIH